MVIDGSILIGKYLEQKNKDEDLNGVNVSGDYFCLLCIVINYIFKIFHVWLALECYINSDSKCSHCWIFIPLVNTRSQSGTTVDIDSTL